MPGCDDGSSAEKLIEAIRTGDLLSLSRILTHTPEMANARIDGQRTALHVATDWPGHYPQVQEVVAVLVEHGADVNTPFAGSHSETPLHWAASSDDVLALDALLDRGANIEATGGVIDGGTPLADAVAFGQWATAKRLVERGAKANLWQAAALDLSDVLEASFERGSSPDRDSITNAFWCACHGGQLRSAGYLLERGADINWIGHDGLRPLDAATRNGSQELIAWLRANGARSAEE